jgi:hypothetical protein
MTDTVWVCEGCNRRLNNLADSDLVEYVTTEGCWICLSCSQLKPITYVRILRRDLQGPERRRVERSATPE